MSKLKKTPDVKLPSGNTVEFSSPPYEESWSQHSYPEVLDPERSEDCTPTEEEDDFTQTHKVAGDFLDYRVRTVKQQQLMDAIFALLDRVHIDYAISRIKALPR